MKIDFVASDANVNCKVTIAVPGMTESVIWTFVHVHSDKYYAGFACDAMATQMRDALQKIRTEAYEAGWRDAKAKKGGKRTFFSRWWT